MERMTRISLPLSVEEREAYRAWAKQNRVDPRAHMRNILRTALVNSGHLQNKNTITQAAAKQRA